MDQPLSLWLSEVKNDLDTPDRRAELRQEREILIAATAEGDDNTPFTADEQDEIAKELREIKEYARETYKLTAKEAQALEATLSSIEDAARRLGRRDWFNIVVGTLTILQLVLPLGATRHVFLMLSDPSRTYTDSRSSRAAISSSARIKRDPGTVRLEHRATLTSTTRTSAAPLPRSGVCRQPPCELRQRAQSVSACARD